jgi:uncharacterized membrane protein YkvA (DUF1232 family)
VRTLLALGAGVVLAWLLLVASLWRARPDGAGLREAARLLPDVLRLVARLARDRSLPRGVRVRLWLLLAYLASPVDLVPDVVPVLGQADDVVVLLWALRGTVRRAGAQTVEQHWPGSPEGLAALRRLTGQSTSTR